jgi:hypothetical protein
MIFIQKRTETSSGIGTVAPISQDVPQPAAAGGPTGNQSTTLAPSDARAKDQYNRMKAMFAKYNLDFDESTWPSKPSVDQIARVEKPIRMRVRIICHYCQNNYSASKVCTKCYHQRCEQCTRLPPKKTKKGKEREPETIIQERRGGSGPSPVLVRGAAIDAGAQSGDEAGDEADMSRSGLKMVPKRPKRRKEVPLAIPSRTGGQDLVQKEPLERVHRTCCRCQYSFVRDSRACPQCRHVRCIRCPRVPAKLNKWPDGYPGDVIPAEPERNPRQWKKPRIRVRWTCHQCRKLFMEGEYQCANCSHTRCTTCDREPPKRVRRQFSEQATTAVQEWLSAVGSSPKQPDVAGDSVAAASASKAPLGDTKDSGTLK